MRWIIVWADRETFCALSFLALFMKINIIYWCRRPFCMQVFKNMLQNVFLKFLFWCRTKIEGPTKAYKHCLYQLFIDHLCNSRLLTIANWMEAGDWTILEWMRKDCKIPSVVKLYTGVLHPRNFRRFHVSPWRPYPSVLPYVFTKIDSRWTDFPATWYCGRARNSVGRISDFFKFRQT
jgi:hypothetical protein